MCIALATAASKSKTEAAEASDLCYPGLLNRKMLACGLAISKGSLQEVPPLLAAAFTAVMAAHAGRGLGQA